MSLLTDRSDVGKTLSKAATSPATVLFVSANIANLANLAFNMVFARLLGPELFSDLALLLTMKLAALSLLSATQFGLSRLVAAGQVLPADQSDQIAGVTKFSLKICIPICLVLMLFAEAIAGLLSVTDHKSVTLTLLILPALVPISLYRGLAYGRIDLPRIVLSTQLEWIMRLLGGVALWMLGFGLPGIVAAMVASVYAGAVFAGRLDCFKALLKRQAKSAHAVSILLRASAPFAAIQLAQVLILDGDLFIAKSALDAEQAGYLAGLGLVQRMFFFAFLSFSAVLLPLVARKISHQDGLGARQDLINMLVALVMLATVPLLVVFGFSRLICVLLFGEAFAPMSGWAPYAAASALCFAIVHLVVTYWVARGQFMAAYVFAAAGIAMLSALSLATALQPQLGMLVTAKAVFMVALAVVSLIFVARDRT